MDIPFEGQFNGYGVGGAQPATAPAASGFDAEVSARAAQLRTPASAPVAPSAPVTGAPSRFPVPAWLKTAGGFGVRALGPIAAGAALGPVVQAAFEGGANLLANKGSDMSPNPARLNAAAPVAAAAPAVESMPLGDDQVTMGQKNLATAMSPAFAQPATPKNAAVPAVGTGFITNNQTGATTNIDSRGTGFGAAPRDYTGGNAAASFFQAGAHIRNIANNNAQEIARGNLGLKTLTGIAEAQKNTAQAGNFGVRTLAAQEHLKANPGDYAGAGAVAAGRAVPGKNVFMPTMSADKVDVGDTRTGGIHRVTVPAQINETDIQSTMKSRGMTREQVIKRLKDEGRM